MEKVVEKVYIIGGVILITIVIMAMSSCGSSKMYHVGTGQELSKSKCTGNYMYK
tara:strand:- start:186 stop:347 length:162 start_codon:yes stop_codon:yes gene_type:complete